MNTSIFLTDNGDRCFLYYRPFGFKGNPLSYLPWNWHRPWPKWLEDYFPFGLFLFFVWYDGLKLKEIPPKRRPYMKYVMLFQNVFVLHCVDVKDFRLLKWNWQSLKTDVRGFKTLMFLHEHARMIFPCGCSGVKWRSIGISLNEKDQKSSCWPLEWGKESTYMSLPKNQGNLLQPFRLNKKTLILMQF